MLQDAPGCNSGIPGRGPGKGVMDSDIVTHSPGKTRVDGKRERAPAQGVKGSDIPAQL